MSEHQVEQVYTILLIVNNMEYVEQITQFAEFKDGVLFVNKQNGNSVKSSCS
jgi:hypothetical protein